MIETFEKLLAAGRDDALLRYSLGNAYLKAQDFPRAVEHFRAAVHHDDRYSAAWKGLGQALVGAQLPVDAAAAFERGIEVAEAKGDIQAAKEMKVFLKRLAVDP
ncbi:MAG: tetratricopeptide repeat protein [Candidatus Competibacterales bacterium]